ncbi:hypothetical protein MP228_002381 [Amoeboaphelidium protococcarum]|nr:hypothetical protein MP228_002381 [Amoeboaphelidium protococcarum]
MVYKTSPFYKKYLNIVKNLDESGSQDFYERLVARYYSKNNVKSSESKFKSRLMLFYSAFHEYSCQVKLGLVWENQFGVFARESIKLDQVIRALNGFRNSVGKEDASLIQKRYLKEGHARLVGEVDGFDGPAYFMNHSCRPNVTCCNPNGKELRFKAIRPIEEGSQLLISYGSSYFKEKNMKCLCDECK